MPTDLSNQLEQQLRGIQMPEAISWWPLAIGWWLVIALTLFAISFLLFRLYTIKKKNRYRKVATNELKNSLVKWQLNQDTQTYLHNANDILKRIAQRFDTTSVNKSGSEWVNILNRFSKHPLSEEVSQALSEDCYKAESSIDVPLLHQQLQRWLATHRMDSHA